MTKFNPKRKTFLTMDECGYPAMLIHNRPEAQRYLAGYVAYIQTRSGVSFEAAKRTALRCLISYSDLFCKAASNRVEKFFVRPLKQPKVLSQR